MTTAELIKAILPILIGGLFLNGLLIVFTAGIIPPIRKIKVKQPPPNIVFENIRDGGDKIGIKHITDVKTYEDVHPIALLLPFFLRINTVNESYVYFYSDYRPLLRDNDLVHTTPKERLLEHHFICYFGYLREQFMQDVIENRDDIYLKQLNTWP